MSGTQPSNPSELAGEQVVPPRLLCKRSRLVAFVFLADRTSEEKTMESCFVDYDGELLLPLTRADLNKLEQLVTEKVVAARRDTAVKHVVVVSVMPILA